MFYANNVFISDRCALCPLSPVFKSLFTAGVRLKIKKWSCLSVVEVTSRREMRVACFHAEPLSQIKTSLLHEMHRRHHFLSRYLNTNKASVSCDRHTAVFGGLVSKCKRCRRRIRRRLGGIRTEWTGTCRGKQLKSSQQLTHKQNSVYSCSRTLCAFRMSSVVLLNMSGRRGHGATSSLQNNITRCCFQVKLVHTEISISCCVRLTLFNWLRFCW